MNIKLKHSTKYAIAKSLKTVNRLNISLTAGEDYDQAQTEETRTKKYRIRDENEVEILEGKEIVSKEHSPLKTIILTNNVGKDVLKIVHRVGLNVVSICSEQGVVLGETTVSVGFGCCCTIKPRYTFRLKSGKDMLVMKGKISCCEPRLKMKVLGENGKMVGSVFMGDTLSFQCTIQFIPDASSEEERKFVVALCVGMIDSTYEKTLISSNKNVAAVGPPPTAGQSKNQKRVRFQLVSIRGLKNRKIHKLIQC